MTLEADKLAELSDILTAYILDNDLDLTGKQSCIWTRAAPARTDPGYAQSFEKLAPFGTDNRSRFYLKDFKVDNTTDWSWQ